MESFKNRPYHPKSHNDHLMRISRRRLRSSGGASGVADIFFNLSRSEEFLEIKRKNQHPVDGYPWMSMVTW